MPLVEEVERYCSEKYLAWRVGAAGGGLVAYASRSIVCWSAPEVIVMREEIVS